MTVRIIGICGYKGAGKSTVAEAAINLFGAKMVHRFQRIGFADIMVEMLITMGVDRQTAMDKSKWDEPQEILQGRSVRYAARTIGTEWGRDLIGDNVWTDLTINRAKSYNGVTVIDNVRFINEAKAVTENGGLIVSFARDGLTLELNERSEREIPTIAAGFCDYSFMNPGNELAFTAERFARLLDQISRSA